MGGIAALVISPFAYSSFPTCQYLPGLKCLALRAETVKGETKKRKATRRRATREKVMAEDGGRRAAVGLNGSTVKMYL